MVKMAEITKIAKNMMIFATLSSSIATLLKEPGPFLLLSTTPTRLRLVGVILFLQTSLSIPFYLSVFTGTAYTLDRSIDLHGMHAK